jgi:hypothetical protein
VCSGPCSICSFPGRSAGSCWADCGDVTSGATLGAVGALTVGGLSGLINGLVQLGLPEEIATGRGEHVHKGDTLLIAHASSARPRPRPSRYWRRISPAPILLPPELSRRRARRAETVAPTDPLGAATTGQLVAD